MEVRSRNHCCRGRTINVPYPDRVSVALVIQHATRMRLWPARLYNIFPHYLINGTIFEKTLLIIKCVF
jgi:hypothetical protein